MIQYHLELTISNSNTDSSTFQYTIHLTPQEENYPKQKFKPQFCQELRRDLQQETSCKINQANLKKIINLWIEDIKEGYRTTTISIDLQTSIVEDLKAIHDKGNQELPDFLSPNLSSIEPKKGELPNLNFS